MESTHTADSLCLTDVQGAANMQLEKKGCVVKANLPQHSVPSLVGGSNIPLASKGGRVGCQVQGLWGPLICPRLGLGRTGKGAGVVVGVSLVDRLRSRSSSGGRREDGTQWSHECGILTRTSLET